MIKCETVGMLDIAKINPVLTSANDVVNNSFLTVDGITYVILNDINGDDAYKDGVTIKAGEYLNGYDLSAWAGQKLVIDEKHITYASGADYDDITAGTTLLKPKTDGTLEVTATASESGVYFKVTDKVTLTGKAVKVLIMGV